MENNKRKTFEIIYDSDDWLVRRDEDGELEITTFSDGHWQGAIHITRSGIWEE
jgi:hypothetical protein